jgi:hypothetical protein
VGRACRCWESVQSATRCGSLVVIYDGKRYLQAGVAPQGMLLTSEPPALVGGICDRVMSTGKGVTITTLGSQSVRRALL